MNKQRPQVKQSYQLQAVARTPHGLSPFQRNQPQMKSMTSQPQQGAFYHVGGMIQQMPGHSATKVMPIGKRIEALQSKENLPVMSPYGIGGPMPTSQGPPQVERHVGKSPIPMRPHASSCEGTPMTLQLRRQSQLQPSGTRERALVDIGGSMLNFSALPPAFSHTQELMKRKWVHSTPEAEPTKFNTQPAVSASFNIEIPKNDQYQLQMQHKRQNSEGRGSFLQQSLNDENRFRHLDELAEKTKNLQSAEKYSNSKDLQSSTHERQCNNLFTKTLQNMASSKHLETRSSIDSDKLSRKTLETQCSMSRASDSTTKPKTAELFNLQEPLPNRSVQKQQSMALVRAPSGFVQPSASLSALPSPKNAMRDDYTGLPAEGGLNFLKKKTSQREQTTATKVLMFKPSSSTNTNTPVKQQPQRNQQTPTGFQSPKHNKSFFEKPPVKLQEFERGKQLGKGKFGQVFLVRHKLTGFICAIKIINKQSIREDKLEDQLARQLKILCFVKHPNLIACYGFFADTQNVYILMELCSGGHLFKQIQDKRRLPEAEAAYLIRQVCEGIKYLHSLHILHRDIKPQNIILESGIAKICDFGWSVFSGGLRKTVCGTPLYLSPEVVKGEDYDEKIDLWALGILTYELLIGRIPFKIWSEAQLTRIVSDEVTFPDYVEISDRAKNFVMRILEKEPSKRCSLDDLLGHPFLSSIKLIEDCPLLQ